MAAQPIEQAAELLCRARLGGERFAQLPQECRPPDEATAYRVQSTLHGKLTTAGWGEIVGHKIGCTTPVMQRFLGVDNPCAGGVFAPTVQHERGTFRHADFRHVGVECEIAVRLTEDLPGSATPYDRDVVTPAIGACMAAIEVVDDRYQDYKNLDLPTLVADDFFNAACVLGQPMASWHGLDLAAISGRMTINGIQVGTGCGGDILGHPFNALAWLANALVARGHYLRAGEFVLLGSVVETKWVEAGDEVAIEIDGLGVATATFL